MISAKPMAVVAMLALAGGVVAQEKAEEQRKPVALRILGLLPKDGLQSSGLISELMMRDAIWRHARAELAELRRSGAGRDRVRDLEAMIPFHADRVQMQWNQVMSSLADDYHRIREEQGDVPVELMQLFLIGRLACANPDDQIPRPPAGSLSEADFGDLAGALLSAARTPREAVLARVFMLHAGRDLDTRIESATTLAQMKGMAAEVVPHLVEELVPHFVRNPRVDSGSEVWDLDVRTVQAAITALGMIGPAAKDAIPTLEKLAEHEDRQIAERAKAALRQVRGR